MRTKNFRWMVGFITVAMALAGLPLFAQTEKEAAPSVAYVSLINGNVSMQRGTSGQWMAVTVNTPLLSGDSIATGPGSRAEIQLNYSNVLRLAENSEATIADLSPSRIQLQVPQGTADLVVFQGNQASSEVDTPNVAVEPLREGTYRIDVSSSSLSLVTVRRGEAQISTPQGSTTISEGQQITIEGAENPRYQIASARPLDNWDQWNSKRNRVFENAENYNHVNRYYSGAQDLGAYGHWVYVPNYDWCWTPYINAGWVPYSNGRWVWEPYYGWTWVSYEPWGWAPFHYGRWFFYGTSWYWWPGYVTPYYYPVWGPAWVSFFGFGYGYHRFSFGFGYGFRSIGWCPLGPRDPFHPWWGRGHSFNVVNFNNYYGRDFRYGGRGFHGSNLAAVFSNYHVRRAIVTMPADRFGRGAVMRNHQVVSAAMLRQADVVHGTLPVVPTRESMRVTNRAAFVPAVARGRSDNAHFFTRRPVAARNFNQSFNNQAASIRRMVQTHNARAVEANRGFQFSRPIGPQQRVAQGNQQNWRRFGPYTQAESARRGQQRSFGTQVRGNAERRRPAPVVREAPQSNQSGGGRFGTGRPAERSWGNAGHQSPAPVIREAPQGRQNLSPRGVYAPQSNQSGWRRFSGNSPASPRQAQERGMQRFSPRVDSGGRGQQNGGGGFRNFTRQPAPQRSGGFYSGAPRTQRNYQPRYQRQQNSGSQYYSRPPLRLNKPIVTERRQSFGAPRARSAPAFRGGGFRGSSPHPSRGSGGGGRRR